MSGWRTNEIIEELTFKIRGEIWVTGSFTESKIRIRIREIAGPDPTIENMSFSQCCLIKFIYNCYNFVSFYFPFSLLFPFFFIFFPPLSLFPLIFLLSLNLHLPSSLSLIDAILLPKILNPIFLQQSFLTTFFSAPLVIYNKSEGKIVNWIKSYLYCWQFKRKSQDGHSKMIWEVNEA